MLTSDDAFLMVKKAGIITNKQTFLRYVREGKILGELRHKRNGYRFKEENITKFIDLYQDEKTENPFVELHRLRRENEELRHRLKTPESMTQAENIRLSERVKELEEVLEKTKKNQPFHLPSE